MTLNEDQAARHVTPVNSPWDGTLEEKLETWGYNDISHERSEDCDFEETNRLKTAFDALGIDTRDASAGGSSHCFTIFHWNGSAVKRDNFGNLPPVGKQYYTVNDRRYRVTGAHFTIGVNEKGGVIYFLNRASPEEEARRIWNIKESEPVPKDEMPALRSSSDVAWGFWNRRIPHNLGFIRSFLSVTIMNEETGDILDTALNNAGLDEVPTWPGVRFDSGSPEYLALMGSPNGLATGYFLTQHKKQMGGNRYVAFIIVFREDDITGTPFLFSSVDWAPSPPPPPREDEPEDEDTTPKPPGTTEDPESPKALGGELIGRGEGSLRDGVRGKVLGRGRDGRQVMREHVVWGQ